MSNKALKLAKAQAGTQARRSSSATRWPDGTPKSLGNDFTAHLDGRLSAMASPKDLANAKHAQVATRTVEQLRALGRDTGTLMGLSAKSDEEIRRRRQQSSLPTPARRRATVAPKAPAP